ncbi:MAG: lamin tail domain-containing protein [Pyrinomonadaceae bacterium]
MISQLYGGGGNSAAPLRNDFIELFNSGTTTVNLAGWSVQYSSASGSTWAVTALPQLSLVPGQHCLIQQASSGSNGVALPAADAIGTIGMAATAGKVALVRTSTALAGSCPVSGDIVDFVGYGTNASCFRGIARAPAPGNSTAIIRAGNGCSDTQNNASDFAVGPPVPRNSSVLPNVCSPGITTSRQELWMILFDLWYQKNII